MALFNYECDEVKHIIDEVSPNYPQLTTYEKEWLYFHKYGYIPGVPVELEYETVSVNPSGSVSNAIPFQYKSAILKGNTLVNITKPIEFDATLTTTGLQHLESYYGIYNTTPATDKQYLVCCYIHENTIGTFSLNKTGLYTDIALTSKSDITQTSGVVKYIANCNGDGKTLFTIGAEENAVAGRLHITCMVLEYQEGMENWDIPYFEGMKSVKLPILTTTGKNLFGICEFEKGAMGGYPSTNVIITNNSISLGEMGASVVVKLKGKPNTEYTISFTVNNTSTMILREWNDRTQTPDVNGEVIWRYGTYNLNTNNGLYKLENIQIEESSVATSYEPYKSNSLTVNESVELRGIGDVKDELNLITGELTQRIGENNEVLAQKVVKTVDLTPLNKPYDGANHYELTSNIPCEAILEVPVVSTGKQTLEKINN